MDARGEIPDIDQTQHDSAPAGADVPVPQPDIDYDGMVRLPGDTVPVVGLGGSSGSLPALERFLSNLSPTSGAGYVIVVHLAPEHESQLADILQRSTSVPVRQVTDSVKILPDNVYVIPPGKAFSMTDGHLQACDLTRSKGRHVTIDMFFRTLAETHGSKAVAVVLSGSDGDGAMGLKRIKERGGLTIAQTPTEAEFDSMPRAAIGTGMVDWILPATDMPLQISSYWYKGEKIQMPDRLDKGEQPGENQEAALRKILALLKVRTGHDFEYYKRATIIRRIERRMQVNGSDDMIGYLEYLRAHPGEAGALLQDLLISVTNFFRDKEAYHLLESQIPALFRQARVAEQLRVWVPACATGEEAYSIAMLLWEYAATLEKPPKIQVIATDIDQPAIDVAREGRYTHAIVADVTEERLRRFFVSEHGGYRVKRELREIVLFALHDILRDAPFSRLDLVCCRNLLIYLNREAQSKVFEMIHFSLRDKGYLFLGSSESAEEAASLFAPVDKKHRLYSRRVAQRFGMAPHVIAPSLEFPLGQEERTHARLPGKSNNHRLSINEGELPSPSTWTELHWDLTEHVSPPSIVVNLQYDIVHLSKSAGIYLHVAGGEPTINLLQMIHPKLRTELRAALFRGSKSRTTVRLAPIPVEIGKETRNVSISVEWVGEITSDFLLVVLDDRPVSPEQQARPVETACNQDSGIVQHLEDELEQLRRTWKNTVEQYEASNEELKASNEELHAMNEELRSATEELETGREELQSINEEIVAINQELKGKIDELGRANSDLQNLMASTKIATIFLDRNLHIKRFTPSSTGLFNFIPSDLGRPLSHLTHRLDYPEIAADADGVITNLTIVEREVRNLENRWFLVRMFPYRTTEDQIAGVVITCVDITERKENEESRRWLSAIVESSNDAIISFSMEGNIVSWNQGAEHILGYTAEEIVGRPQTLLAPPELQEETQAMLATLQSGDSIPAFETVRLRKDGTKIDVSVSASVMKDQRGNVVAATAIARDITIQKQAVEDLREARNQLEARVEQRTAELQRRVKQLAQMASEVTMTEQRERMRLARILHDELQQLVVSAKMRIEALPNVSGASKLAEIENLSHLMDEILTNSRSLAIDLSPPVLSEGLGSSLVWLAQSWMPEKYHLQVDANIDVSLDVHREDMRSLLFFAVKELLFNAVKHSKVDRAELELKSLDPGRLQITVRDRGVGFSKLDVSTQGPSKASGLGLIGLSERMEMLGGTLEISSEPGQGVTAILVAPLTALDVDNH